MSKIFLDLRIFSIQQHGGISIVWREYIDRIAKVMEASFSLVACMPIRRNTVAKELNLGDYEVMEVASRSQASKYLPYFLRGRKDDILHMSYYGLYPFFRGKKIVTVHDFTHEKYGSLKQKIVHILPKYLSLIASDVILCISNTTKNDMLELYPSLASKTILVTPNAVSEAFHVKSKDSLCGDVDKNFFLWVGQRGGYKNFIAALHFLQQCVSQGGDYALKVVGGGAFTPNEIANIGALGLESNVEHCSMIPERDLIELYQSAHALLYLSKYEGFGLPILEAQRCGCPVVVLDIPTSQEVGGDAVIIYDSNRPVQAILDVLGSPDQRKRLVRNGLDNAGKYNWDDTVNRITALYRELING